MAQAGNGSKGDDDLALDYVLGILDESDFVIAAERLGESAGFARLVAHFDEKMKAEGWADSVDPGIMPPAVNPRAGTWEAILDRISVADRR